MHRVGMLRRFGGQRRQRFLRERERKRRFARCRVDAVGHVQALAVAAALVRWKMHLKHVVECFTKRPRESISFCERERHARTAKRRENVVERCVEIFSNKPEFCFVLHGRNANFPASDTADSKGKIAKDAAFRFGKRAPHVR
ncbi:hypothetical protein SDC9_112320 [bioreactor metagenome]|uniref:Uncharacterized protein n=1 Tax=bioreactor metagenome TaxID=1076179 RepID=A0A645BUF2_9ZZZZ